MGGCLAGQHCKAFQCCYAGSSCNTCPFGWEWNNYDCAWKGNAMCKGESPAPTPAPTPGWCLPGEHCNALDCCAWGTSCNTCPNGYFAEANWCLLKGLFMCKSESPAPSPSCGPSTFTRPQGNCNQALKKSHNWDTCIMADGRTDLPQVTNKKLFDVTLLRKTIIGATDKQHLAAETLGLFHSAVLIQSSCASERETFLIEFDAENFDQRVILPTITGKSITWDNLAYVGWYPTFNASEWSEPDAVTFIGGGVSGWVINSWLDEIPKWYNTHKSYLVWSDYEARIGDPQLLFKDRLCHEFSEWSIQMIYTKGADFSSNQAAICRNYVPLVGNGFPQKLEPSNSEDFRQIESFYASFAKYLEEAMKNPYDKGQGLRTWMEKYKKFVLHNETGYYLAHLSYPYLAAIKNFTMRPMHLNWQNPALFEYGTCEWRSTNVQASPITV